MIFQKVKNKFILIPIIYLFLNQCRQLLKVGFNSLQRCRCFFFFPDLCCLLLLCCFFAVFVVVCCGLLLFVVV